MNVSTATPNIGEKRRGEPALLCVLGWSTALVPSIAPGVQEKKGIAVRGSLMLNRSLHTRPLLCGTFTYTPILGDSLCCCCFLSFSLLSLSLLMRCMEWCIPSIELLYFFFLLLLKQVIAHPQEVKKCVDFENCQEGRKPDVLTPPALRKAS